MLRRSWPGALLTLVSLAFPAPAQEVKLEWKFKPGDKFYLQTDSSVKQTMRTPSLGKELKQETEQSTLFSVSVEAVNADKSVVLEYKIEGVIARSATGGGAAALEEKLQQQLTGATFKVTLGAKGEVTKFEGYEDLVKKLAGDDENAKKVIRALFSEDELKAKATDALRFLPDGPVKIDAEWERDSKWPLGPLGSFELKKKYTYKGIEKAVPINKALPAINYHVPDPKYSPPPKPEGAPLPIQVAKGDLRAENFKGTVYFDAEAGRLAYAETTLTVKGTVSFAGQGQGGNVDTEVSLEQTIKTKVLDKNPLQPK
jgi:hypothetical protein